MPAGESKRPRPAFSPPRPQGSKTTNGSARGATKAGKPRSQPSMTASSKKKRVGSPSPAESEQDEDADLHSPAHSLSPASEPDFMLAEIIHAADKSSDEPTIPSNLLHRLLHHHFKNKDKTRITTDAKEVFGKYIEVFVREAIARSAHESQEKGDDDDGMDTSGADGFLEVAHLEKMGVQLVLDF